jgi:ABC-type transport system involved in cytochrome bd biosynthesis fused ATPase/permease subunit
MHVFCTGPSPLVQLECPSGSYCPAASKQPLTCSPLAVCSAGSQRYLHVGCLVLLAVVLPMLFLAPLCFSTARCSCTRSAAAEQDVAEAVPGQSTGVATRGAALLAAIHSGPRTVVQFKQLRASVDVSGVPLVTIDGLSGSIAPGTLTAVMGPSGAGQLTCTAEGAQRAT